MIVAVKDIDRLFATHLHQEVTLAVDMVRSDTIRRGQKDHRLLALLVLIDAATGQPLHFRHALL